MSSRLCFVLSAIVLVGPLTSPFASAQNIRAKTIVRVFWQDRETNRLSYANITTTNRWGINRGWVKDFPKAAVRHDGPMVQAGGILLVGVESEESQQGWVAVDSGVFEEPHGNHFHWRYTGSPAVKKTALTANGAVGRLFESNRQFFVSKATGGGFFSTTPAAVKQSGRSVRQYPGGGPGAAVATAGSAAYATWTDSDGDHAGQVDVVDLKKSSVAYFFKLPEGDVRAAAATNGKIFFAPADGLCWVTADPSVSRNADAVMVNQLPLSAAASGTPVRTTSLTTMGSWVICTTGDGAQSALCMLNAASAQPAVVRLPIPLEENLQLTEPQCILSLGKRYALIFQERIDPTLETQEQLTIIDLDPNRDRNFTDAAVQTTLSVGASRIEGDFGHHSISFDAYGRYAVFTEPQDGILNVLSLQKKQVVARYRVGGIPDKIIAIGAAEHFH